MLASCLTKVTLTSQSICSSCLRSFRQFPKFTQPQKILSTSVAFRQNTSPPGDFPPMSEDNHSLAVHNTSLIRQLPLMTNRKLEFPSLLPTKQAWLETLSQIEDEKLGIVDLHPNIFGVFPRIDLLWENIRWQNNYKRIDYRKVKSRAERRGGGRKPWRQKGLGKARHGSIRSPLWHKGGKAHGPRGPKSYFYMLPVPLRVSGLLTALTVKYAQDNLHIVDSLELPSDDPKYLQELVESRGWGLSVLFVDDTDLISRNLALATSAHDPYNVMPVYGLNVYSMLKHETLVLSLDALDKIEHKLLQAINNVQHREKRFQPTVQL